MKYEKERETIFDLEFIILELEFYFGNNTFPVFTFFTRFLEYYIEESCVASYQDGQGGSVRLRT